MDEKPGFGARRKKKNVDGEIGASSLARHTIGRKILIFTYLPTTLGIINLHNCEDIAPAPRNARCCPPEKLRKGWPRIAGSYHRDRGSESAGRSCRVQMEGVERGASVNGRGIEF
jgi:hypothetical protein